MTLSETYKVKAVLLNFCGDVLKILNEISLSAEYGKDCEKNLSRIQAIKKFCVKVEDKLNKLILDSQFSYDGENLKEDFSKQVKAIKKLCEGVV